MGLSSTNLIYTDQSVYVKLLTENSSIINNYTYWDQQCSGE